MSGGAQTTTGWLGERERSQLWVLRLMVWISLRLGRRVGRLVLFGIAAYFLLFARRARRASRDYLGRVLGRPAGWADAFRHVWSFASTIHDRVYLLHDRFDLFEIEVTGSEPLHTALARGQGGALLLGAHLGSFEVLRSVGRGRAGLRVSMLMYEHNARKINAALQIIHPAASHDIIALGRLQSMLEVRAKLDSGYLVGMLADRRLADEEAVEYDFLGSVAAFPVGPFRLAALLRRPVFFMTGLYLGGNRYRIHFEPLADFSLLPEQAGDCPTIGEAQARYVARLEHYCRLAPTNWFNFFDFWQGQK